MARWPVPRLPQPPGPVSDPGPGPGAAPAAGLRPFDRRVIWAGGVVSAVLMALSPRYGFHRDELYFLDAARHLQASYVDQPVLTPLLAWVSLKLLSGGRAMLLNRWFLAGAAIAVAFTVPDLWWQAQHQWATIAMTQALNQANGGLGNAGTWVIGQVIMVTLALVWVWLAGLRFLWRSRRPLWRALAWAYGLLFILFAVTTGAKIYYLAGTYPYLLAAGFVAVDGWLAARRGRVRNLMLATALTTAVALPIVLPVLPAADVGWTYTVSGDSGESIGWPQLAQTVQKAWLSLAPAQRAHAVTFTANYGEAGAINELGRADGLPAAVSGHNTDWWWGPGNPRATTVVAVVPGDAPRYHAFLSRFFTSVRPVATLSNPAGIRNQEWHGHLYLCTGPKSPWAQLWPLLRHYS